MRESLITGTIAAVAVSAAVVSGPSLLSNPVTYSTPSTPVTLDFAPPQTAPVPPVVQPPSAPPVSPPAGRTAPGIATSVPPDEVPGGQVPPLETVAPSTEPTTTPTDPCPIGLVFDHVLGVCVSI